jgi:peptidase A4-like protein
MNHSFRALGALALALSLTACNGSVDIGGLARRITSASAPAASAAADQSEAAIKAVIQRGNDAQAKAYNTGDNSLMKDTATDSFYQQLLGTNRDLARAGVAKIEILSTDFQSVSVDGATAKATTLENWRSTYPDGSSDEQTARNDYTLVLVAGAWMIDSDEQPTGLERPAPQTSTDTGTPTAATSGSTSSNWSGYSASGGGYTSVTGTWTVPNVSPTIAGADATWVGIGGIETRDLIQAGTQASVSGGEVAYDAWIEMLPASSKTISLSVNPGDSVTVSITQKSGLDWTIAMKNNTTGGRYTTTVQYQSSGASAEWVQEAPSVGRGTVPLDDFGMLRFSGASAVKAGKTLDLRGLDARAITMINGARQALAIPSVIGDDGASFSVMRTQASGATPGGGTGRRRRG